MPHRPRDRSALIGILAVLIMYALFGGVLYLSGVLRVRGPQANEKVALAILAFAGAFVGALVSVVGILLKNSLDRRTEQRLQIESERNAVLQAEAEKRLKLEAAIRALELLATDSGTLAHPIQRSGALYTLANLGQHDLTIGLIPDLVRKKDLDACTVARLVDQALKLGDEPVQREAINVLLDHINTLLTPESFEFPRCILDGCSGLSPYVRMWAAISLGELLAARPLTEWQHQRHEAAEILGALAICWSEEPEPRAKTQMGAILCAALQPFDDMTTLYHPRRTIDLASVRIDVASLKATGAASQDLVRTLTDWSQSGSADIAQISSGSSGSSG